jgi:hypothetical protein
MVDAAHTKQRRAYGDSANGAWRADRFVSFMARTKRKLLPRLHPSIKLSISIRAKRYNLLASIGTGVYWSASL